MAAKPQPHRGPWSPEEQRAIEAAIAEGRITRVENGFWRETRRFTWHQLQREFYAAMRDPMTR